MLKTFEQNSKIHNDKLQAEEEQMLRLKHLQFKRDAQHNMEQFQSA